MSDLLLSCVCESDFIMPNLASFLKPSKSSSGGNKTSERSSKTSFRRLSRKENFTTEGDDSKGKQTLELDGKSSSSRPSPRLGLFRRHLGSKSTSVLRKVGSSSRILDCTSSPSCSSSSLATTTSSPFHTADGSQTRAGMPKCSTVANFGPSKTGLYLPNIAPYKCNSVATFTPSRSGGLSPSRCNSTVSFNLSQCGSTLNFSVSGCDTSQNNLSASRPGSTSSLSPPVTETVYIYCKLCLMDLPYTEMVSLNSCNCLFCRTCMMQYLMFQIKDGNTSISCPDAQCEKQGKILSEEVESMVEKELYEKYQRYLLNEEVDMDPLRTWCPKAGCETICPVSTKGSSRSVSVSCSTCGYQFCSQCKARWHGSQTCDAYARQLAKLSTYEDGLVLSDDENAVIKRCPWCNVPIERDNGCAQMMCKRCKHVFCWYCLTSLDDDFLLRHYDKGPCKNKLGHSRASVLWHRTQVIGIFAGFGLLVLVASPLLLLAAPCILCCKCKSCAGSACSEEETSDATTQ